MLETKHLQEWLRRVTKVVRYARRCENVYQLKAQLLVYSCLIDAASGATPWTTFDSIERCVESRLEESAQPLPKALRWILLEAVGGRLIEASSEGYRLTRVGIAAVADHSARIQRHHAMQWEEKLQEAQQALDEFEATLREQPQHRKNLDAQRSQIITTGMTSPHTLAAPLLSELQKTAQRSPLSLFARLTARPVPAGRGSTTNMPIKS